MVQMTWKTDPDILEANLIAFHTVINRKVVSNRRVQMIILKAKTTIGKRTIVEFTIKQDDKILV